MAIQIQTYVFTVRGVEHRLHTKHRLVRAKMLVGRQLHEAGHPLDVIREAQRSLRLDDSGLRR